VLRLRRSRVTLSGTTAQLTPVFGVNDLAAIIVGGGATTPMGLTDPDSNRYLPAVGGGTLIQVAQGDSKLVLATNLASGKPTLKQLTLTNATTARHGAATPQPDDMDCREALNASVVRSAGSVTSNSTCHKHRSVAGVSAGKAQSGRLSHPHA
jgi:hypothetical protein